MNVSLWGLVSKTEDMYDGMTNKMVQHYVQQVKFNLKINISRKLVCLLKVKQLEDDVIMSQSNIGGTIMQTMGNENASHDMILATLIFCMEKLILGMLNYRLFLMRSLLLLE